MLTDSMCQAYKDLKRFVAPDDRYRRYRDDVCGYPSITSRPRTWSVSCLYVAFQPCMCTMCYCMFINIHSEVMLLDMGLIDEEFNDTIPGQIEV